MPDAEVAAAMAREITVACRMEVAVLGTFCADGECRVMKSLVTGTFYESDDWVIGFHEPGDPMKGEQMSGTGAEQMLSILRRIAHLGDKAREAHDKVAPTLVAVVVGVVATAMCRLWPICCAGYAGIVG